MAVSMISPTLWSYSPHLTEGSLTLGGSSLGKEMAVLTISTFVETGYSLALLAVGGVTSVYLVNFFFIFLPPIFFPLLLCIWEKDV